MKKLLALLLALLMMLSVALVSCGDDEPEDTTIDNEDLFGDITTDDTDDTDENGEDEEGGENGEDEENNGLAAGYTATNDTVYVLFPAALREDDKISATKIADLKFGTPLTRVATSKKWSKISYDGKEAYILNVLVDTDQRKVTFEAPEVAEGEVVKAKVVVSGATLNLRSYPFILDDYTSIEKEAFSAVSEIGKISNGEEITILEISADGIWAKVECKAYAKGDKGEYDKEKTTMTGYCSLSYTDYYKGTNNNGGTVLG